MASQTNWKAQHKDEIVEFVRKFYRTSYDWRRQAYHDKWDRYERNYRQIYDPAIKAKKEPWQTTLFIPATTSNVEVVTASLTKIASGTKRAISIEPREGGDELQAELNNSLMDYFTLKGDYAVGRYDCTKEIGIYGSAFMKIFYERKWAKRWINKPVVAGIMEAVKRGVLPGTKVGDKKQMEDTLVYQGIKYACIHIRDIFLEPNSKTLERLIHRDKIVYAELYRMAEEGMLDKESVDALWMHYESDKFEEDISTLKYEQNLQDPTLPRPSFDKKHTVWEFFGPVPMKWVKLEMPEDTEEQKKKAAELVPGRLLVASGNFYLASTINEDQAMEPPFIKMDYIRTGQTYGLGVAELMGGLQEELNEARNLRMDNVNLVINKMFAVIEKYMVDPKEFRSMPGALMRFKGADLDDVRKALMEIPISDVAISAFKETFEIERQIQEVTAANRVTTGTAGMVKDQNQTLGGMELLKQAAFDRFMVYAYIIGRQFDIKASIKTMELIYLNVPDEMIQAILGNVPIEYMPQQYVPKWETWKRLPPHEFNVCYDFIPTDVFSQENKMGRSQILANNMQLTAQVIPNWNPEKGLKKMWSLSGFAPEEINEILGDMSQQAAPPGGMPTPGAMGQRMQPMTKPTNLDAPSAPANPVNSGVAVGA